MKRVGKFSGLVALVVVLAIPVGAQAREEESSWTHGGEVIKEEIHIPFTGSFSFSGGTNCANGVHLTKRFKLFRTGTVTSLTITVPTNCEVTGTLKALGCTVTHSITGINPPWVTHNRKTRIVITGVKLLYHYTGGAFCPKMVTVEGDMTATPDNPQAIGSLTLSGELTSSLGTKVTVGGSQAPVNASDVGTYGLY